MASRDNVNPRFQSDSEPLRILQEAGVFYLGGVILLHRATDYQHKVLVAARYLADEWDYAVEWVDAGRSYKTKKEKESED